MPRYVVKTFVTFERFYDVEAADPQGAIAETMLMNSTTEALMDEETMGVYLDGIKVFDPDKHPATQG